MNAGEFSLAATSLKPQQIPMSLHISARVWGHRRYTHIKIVGFYVKTAITHQIKRLCVPDCTYMESTLINYIHIRLCSISPMQTILYKLKWVAAVEKRLMHPAYAANLAANNDKTINGGVEIIPRPQPLQWWKQCLCFSILTMDTTQNVPRTKRGSNPAMYNCGISQR